MTLDVGVGNRQRNTGHGGKFVAPAVVWGPYRRDMSMRVEHCPRRPMSWAETVWMLGGGICRLKWAALDAPLHPWGVQCCRTDRGAVSDPTELRAWPLCGVWSLLCLTFHVCK